ncbi:MAG: glycoside hydrolase family 97 protein [Bacteroidales bacterium]|nr:glycoside hydrolase family 97 protein [Bacteroidales bacterium]
MKHSLLTIILLILFGWSASAQTYELNAPDGSVTITVNTGDTIRYSVTYNGKKVLVESPLLLEFSESPPLGRYMSVNNHEYKTIDHTWEAVTGQQKEIRNHCRELRLKLEERRFPGRKLTMVFRAYNDGMAFRYFLPELSSKPELVLTNEYSTFHFPENYTAWMANYGSFTTHQEKEFRERPLSHIESSSVVGLPLTVKHSENLYIAVTEANLEEWSGMYVARDEHARKGVRLRSKLSPAGGNPDNSTKVNISTPQYSPWRVMMIGESPGDLIESDMVMNLNEPCEIKDPSWIEPGISAWDHWWSGGVQMNTGTIKEYIDLAAEMGWKYQLIDWQWYGQYNEPDADVTTVNPDVDMPGVLQYAKDQGVKCWLWLYWSDIDGQLEEAFALYEKWGIAGVKIDFMTRDDQEMVNWYHKVVKEAAEHHLMVNFHGAYKPTGLRRTLPNLMTREGVLGNEYNAWSTRITPDHDVTLPFTRMLAGQMDYTPGGFLNRAKGEFRAGHPTQVMGTRCHTLAKFVVYNSPITVACDRPEHYYEEPGIEFLKEVPTVWDETKVINGAIGEYITMARKKGDRWFIGSMTNSSGRTLTVPLDFLDERDYVLHTFRDTDGAATDLKKGNREVTAGNELTIDMQAGGGYAAYLVPVGD